MLADVYKPSLALSIRERGLYSLSLRERVGVRVKLPKVLEKML
jgi:hypothetical protein